LEFLLGDSGGGTAGVKSWLERAGLANFDGFLRVSVEVHLQSQHTHNSKSVEKIL
jgi:hypothetical protein